MVSHYIIWEAQAIMPSLMNSKYDAFHSMKRSQENELSNAA